MARNPQPDSRLPYLVRLPLEGGLALKTRAPWPATARVYCHRFEEPCRKTPRSSSRRPSCSAGRRGAAIDLVVDRPRQSRSHFAFTQVKGREAIFWQTQKTTRAANPGGRIPRRRSLAGPVTISVDTRERYPYRFVQQRAETVRATVPASDYALYAADGSLLAAVERKSLDNLAATLLGRVTGLPAATLGRARTRRSCRRSEIRGPVQARARQRRLARRPTRPPPGPLTGRQDRLRRLAPLRRRLDLPLPQHSTRRHGRTNQIT